VGWKENAELLNGWIVKLLNCFIVKLLIGKLTNIYWRKHQRSGACDAQKLSEP